MAVDVPKGSHLSDASVVPPGLPEAGKTPQPRAVPILVVVAPVRAIAGVGAGAPLPAPYGVRLPAAARRPHGPARLPVAAPPPQGAEAAARNVVAGQLTTTTTGLRGPQRAAKFYWSTGICSKRT